MKNYKLMAAFKALISTALFLGTLNFAHAQLATWEVTGVNAGATNPFSANTLGGNVLSASLTLGSGVTTSSTADTFGGSNFDQTSLSAAITGGDYISFIITPSAGYSISISSITFNSGVATAVTNFNGSLLSSVTGFTSSDSLLTYSFSTTGAAAQSVSLSGITGLQNVTSAIEFRLYGFRDTTGTSTFRIRNLTGSDLIINGSVSAVPEPATFAFLAGAATLGLAAFRRRHTSRLKSTSEPTVSA
jgi:hypothetical protein